MYWLELNICQKSLLILAIFNNKTTTNKYGLIQTIHSSGCYCTVMNEHKELSATDLSWFAGP